MKTKKYPVRCSKNGSGSDTRDQRRKTKSSTMIKPHARPSRNRKALKERKNTLKIKGKAFGASSGTKLSSKGGLRDPGSACPSKVAKNDLASKGIIDKEKLKKLLSGVAQSKEVEKPTENAPEPTKGKQFANDEVEKRTFQTLHKENVMKPILNKDRLKKVLNGLSQDKDAETRECKDAETRECKHAESGMHLRTEDVLVVNKDKLKTLLSKVYELQEGESATDTSNEVVIVEECKANVELECITGKTSPSEIEEDKSVRKQLKRRRATRHTDGLKSVKLVEQTCTAGFKDKLRRRTAVQKLDVTINPKTSSPTAIVSDRVKQKEIITKESSPPSSDDDDIILLRYEHQSKCKDTSKTSNESDKDKIQDIPPPKSVKALTCNFDKQKLIRLLSGVPQIQDQNAKLSISAQSAITSYPSSNPKQLTDGNANSEGKFNEPLTPEAPFSLSNELLKSNVLTKSGDGSITLRGIMIDRLNAARFRYINEQLYMSTGEEAQHFFSKDPEAFTVYHQGYQSQVSKWPVSPLNIIIDDIARRKQPLIIADFGCGDARLAKSVPNKVHSFDLVALNEYVTACNMAKVPLKSTSVDIAVFCLSLMGTNLSEYLLEANRILKMGGILKIAEVESRFESVPEFIKQLGSLGFSLMKQDTSNKMFVMLDFAKMKNCTKKQLVNITLHPCLYKKR